MDLKSGIRNPEQLRVAIEIAKLNNEFYSDAVWAIHKYKWYNWYQNLHIKENSLEDIENTKIFNQLETEYPSIHVDIEKNIDYEIIKASAN